MNPVLFGANHCYVIQGGDQLARYFKRMEIQDSHADEKLPGWELGMQGDTTYLQLYTADENPLDDMDAVRKQAEEQDHVFDLNA